MPSIIDQIRNRSIQEGRLSPTPEQKRTSDTSIKDLIREQNADVISEQQPITGTTPERGTITTQPRGGSTPVQDYVYGRRDSDYIQRINDNRDSLKGIADSLKDLGKSREEIKSELERRVIANDYSAVPKAQLQTDLDILASTAAESSPSMANAIASVNNEYREYADSQRAIAQQYAQFEDLITKQLGGVLAANEKLGGQLLEKLDNDMKTVLSQYGPEGEQTKRIEDYYRGLGEYISNVSARNSAAIEADAVASGASLGAKRAALSDADAQTFQLFINAKQQEVNDFNNLYNTLNTYLQNYRSEFGQTTDQTIIQGYRDLLALKKEIGQNLLNANTAVEQARINRNNALDQFSAQATLNNPENSRVFASNGVEMKGISTNGYYIGTDGKLYGKDRSGQLVPVN